MESLQSTRARSRQVPPARAAVSTTSQHETNLEMTKVFNAYKAAVAPPRERGDPSRRAARAAQGDPAEAAAAHEAAPPDRSAGRVEERLRTGTLAIPDEPVADMPVEQLEALVRSPDTSSRRRRYVRSVRSRVARGLRRG